jgi:cytoskeletal protein RodZ
MEDLGAYLRKLREEKGISPDKVFDDLRLRPEQVRLIEENRFFELGPFGFAKAMVYKYAGYLEANLDEVMAEFRIMMPDHARTDGKVEKPAPKKKIMLSPNFLWLIGIILFVAILGAILWHAYRQGWLKTPDILKRSAADTTVVEMPVLPEEEVQPKVDPMRERQKAVAVAGTQQADKKAAPQTATGDAVRDSTDHLGSLMGPSQVNVPLH